MKNDIGYIKKFLLLVSILSVIAIIVFGHLGNLSMFLLSTSLLVFTYPWIKESLKDYGKNKKEILEKKTKTVSQVIFDKFFDKFLDPILFFYWLFLLNKCINLPTVDLYILIIWRILGLFSLVLLIYMGIKSYFQTRKERI